MRAELERIVATARPLARRLRDREQEPEVMLPGGCAADEGTP